MEYEKLNLAHRLWKLKEKEIELIEARDRMTITRALYQRQMFFGNKTVVSNFSSACVEDAGYTEALEKQYNGVALLTQYKLSYTREYRNKVKRIFHAIDKEWSG